MTANTVRDAFGRLPEELRIQIIKSSPDPWSLWSLTHASPVMGGVLDRYPLEILEVVLDAAVPTTTRRLMYALLKVRLQRFPASLAEAKEVAIAEVTEVTDDMRSFPLDRAAEAVRYLLATAENVHTWSHACLEHLIQKSLDMRPSTIIEQGRSSSLWEIFGNAESRKDFLPQCTGPPSWVEEQRMMKAFWRLQFILELQDAGNKGRLSSHWSGQEVDVLSNINVDCFYVHRSYIGPTHFEGHQILTASEFLGAVTSGTITSVEAFDNDAYGLPTIHWTRVPAPRCSCAQPLFFERNSKQDRFQQGIEHLEGPPRSITMWNLMSSEPLDGQPYLWNIPFDPFRKFGFAIWDNQRMVDLGMRSGNPRSLLGAYPRDCFRWWSILTEEEIGFFKELQRMREILKCEIPYVYTPDPWNPDPLADG
ncbi:unnamed protein product [Alternaria burnsii]|nr:unnamed protein product [Alternaria burnsii]